MNLTRISLCILLLLWVITAYAQQNDTTELVLTIDSALQWALKKNPKLRIAEEELEKAKATVWEAYATILPQLDANVNFQHAWAIQESTIPNFLKPMLAPLAPYIEGLEDMPDFVRISFGLENTLTYGARITQPLFLGGAGIAGIKIAKASERTAKHSMDQQKESLIFDCVNNFYNCILAKELVVVQEEALAQAQNNLEVVKKKQEVGMATRFDVMRAEVEVANLKPGVISIRNSKQIALTRLRTIIGLSKDVKIVVSGELNYVEDDFTDRTLEDLQQVALTNRPEMLALIQQEYMTRQNINLTRSNFIPKLFFQTDYSFLSMRDDLNFSSKEFSKGFMSALSLQIPLFHGFASVKKYQKAKLDYNIIRHVEKQTTDGIMAEVEVAYNKFKEAKEKYISSRETVDMAEESLRLANLMYEEGANTQLDVLTTRLALTQARVNYFSSLYEYQVARYLLRKVTGKTETIL